MRSVLIAVMVVAVVAGGVAQTPSSAPNPDVHYQLGPDSLPQDGVPKGEMRGPFTLPSQAYPGTQHTYWIYVPAQYDPKTAASLMIFNDGQAFKNMDGDSRAPNVLDNLIYRREIPVMIAVFINPGRRPDQPEPTPQNWGDRDTNRPTEYNTLDDKYARVIVDELMPVLTRDYNIAKDPERRGIGGASSGAIAAFTVAWERPNEFRKVLSIVGSFTNLRGGHQYADLVRTSEKKPIRIYLQDGRNDNRGLDKDGKYDEKRDWFLQNVTLMRALVDKGYDVNYTWGIGKHGQKQGGAILPDMMRWLWRDQPVSTDPNDAVERSFNEPPPKRSAAKADGVGLDRGGFEQVVKPFLTQNCFECHGNEKHKRDLNFEAITASAQTLVDDHDRWELVVQKLRDREMPPDDEPQPAEHQRQAVAGWIAEQLDRLDKVTPPDPGRVTARRLNRAEYNNTVRDLLGVDLQPADDFPQDDSGYGFDNIGDVLSLSPALMEKYMTAAERVSRAAMFGLPKMAPTLTRLRSNGRRTPDAREFPAYYDVTGLSLPNAFHAMYRVPADGEYVFKVSLGGIRPAGSEPITVTLWIDERQAESIVFDPETSARFDDDRQDFGGQTVQFRVTLTGGDHWIAAAIPRVFEGLPARLGGPNPSSRPEPAPKPFKPPASATPERIAQLKKQYEETQETLKKIPFDGARIANVDIGGPYAQAMGPSKTSLARVYTCGHLNGQHQPMCARRIMTDLARRAFRRPVLPVEIEKYLALVRQAQKDEGSFEEGLAVGIQALLVSPDFLFRIERNRPAGGDLAMQRLNQFELASRLSYFLWSSMPDDALRRAADAGTLRDPAVLAAQVRRMLRDPKAHALAEQFGGQWLEFRALESLTRDRERFPDFDDDLRLSMRRETELFFEHLIQDDRSVLEFLDANYSFMNERLARHYGIDGVTGPEFRRVDLTGTPRGGVLTQGSVLTVSSYATRTSPVLRGKWILDNLLNAPPPNPPADVPNLDEKSIGTAASMRDQLTAHRRDPTCASCHKRMDPLGFGLENFDAVGKWRTKDGNFPIDAHGTLPDGNEFDGPVELRKILTSQREAFARGLTSKLLTYALGRGLEKYDSLTVRRITSKLPQADYRFSALVLEIVNSAPFQYRRPVQEARDPASTQKGTK